MFPTDSRSNFFSVFMLFKDFFDQLFIVSKNITDYCNYDKHYQAYEIPPSAFDDVPDWKIIKWDDLESCYVAHITQSGNKKKYTVKRLV